MRRTYKMEWKNYARDIIIEKLGINEYNKRLKKQLMLFQDATHENLDLRWTTSNYKNVCDVFTLISGENRTDVHGIGAQGYARVVENVPLPENDFFVAGALFEVRARHSSFPCVEDNKLGIRSLAIKFGDHEEESPFDLICQTGSKCAFFNTDSFFHFKNGMMGGERTFKTYLFSLPHFLEAHIEAVRWLPDSYSHQHYYAQTVYDLRNKDGRHRLVKFRVISADGSGESGKLTGEQQKPCWLMDSPCQDRHYAKNYLKQEFACRLQKSSINYVVQVQMYEAQNGSKVKHCMYNTALSWPEEEHPWHDLINITLTNVLPTDITEVTHFKVGNHPKNIVGFREPITHHDFQMISQLRVEIHTAKATKILKVTDHFKRLNANYVFTVVTGKKTFIRTGVNVQVSIIGSKSRTAFHDMDTTLTYDLETGSTNIYKMNDVDVGDILCIKVFKNLSPKQTSVASTELDDWYLSHVTVIKKVDMCNRKKYVFPCYRWFTNKVTGMTLWEGKAALPQSNMHPYMKLQREIELQDRKQMYQWRLRDRDTAFANFPGYIAAGSDNLALPKDVQFDDEIWNGLQFSQVATQTYTREDAIEEKALLISQVMEHSVIRNHVIHNWDKDEEFGRQVLQGVNPTKIVQVNRLPENFPVTHAMVMNSLKPGKSLFGEIKAGKIYLVSYPELEEFASMKPGQGRYLCAPMCLLYANDEQLIPIAIQLTQKPSKSTPIFTQKDNKGKYSDWLIAKMWVKVADVNYHQLAMHLLGTHLVMEPVAMAMMRNLPSMHPVFKLMIPHLRFVMAINTLGRKVLIPPGTAIDTVLSIGETPGQHIAFMERIYKKFTYSSLDIPRDLEARGVTNAKLLPGYYYRDDALILWNALNLFITQIVNIYYGTDAEVNTDEELNRMNGDLNTHGYHEKGKVPPLKAKDDLIHFLTAVIFRCSCQHAAVNFGQMDYYGFAPNSPSCLMMPPPERKSLCGLTDADMKKLLPPHSISQRAISLYHLLSSFSDAEIFLGDYPDDHFTDPEAQAAIRQFQYHLKEISATIHHRNKDLTCPYNYLLPERVPNSIAI